MASRSPRCAGAAGRSAGGTDEGSGLAVVPVPWEAAVFSVGRQRHRVPETCRCLRRRPHPVDCGPDKCEQVPDAQILLADPDPFTSALYSRNVFVKRVTSLSDTVRRDHSGGSDLPQEGSRGVQVLSRLTHTDAAPAAKNRRLLHFLPSRAGRRAGRGRGSLRFTVRDGDRRF